MTPEERIIELETKVAYQEHTIQQLNDIVTAQQKKLDKLEAGVKELIGRLRDVSGGLSDINPTHEKPPHY
jgi:SlyX protein